jgi:uncharacterized membrane protein
MGFSTVNKTRSLVMAAIIAAAYVSLVVALAPISFGPIQVRVADALVGIVPLVGMPGVIGITIGVLIGNIPSPIGPLDLLSAIPTCIALLLIIKIRKVSVMAGLVAYSVILSAWVGLLLSYAFNLPYLITFCYLLIGIGFATGGLGYILYKIMKKVMGSKLV